MWSGQILVPSDCTMITVSVNSHHGMLSNMLYICMYVHCLSLFSHFWSTRPNVSIAEETPIYNWICPRMCPPTSYFHSFPMIRSQVWCMCWVCVCVCLCVVFLPLSVGVCQAAVTELRGKWEKCVSIRHTHEHIVTTTTSRTHTCKKGTGGNSASTRLRWMTNTVTHLFRKH